MSIKSILRIIITPAYKHDYVHPHELLKYTQTHTHLSAAWQTVPQVSAISSTKMATRSLTSPTRTMRSTSLAFFLSLWMRAKSTFSRSAMDVTLRERKQNKLKAGKTEHLTGRMETRHVPPTHAHVHTHTHSHTLTSDTYDNI